MKTFKVDLSKSAKKELRRLPVPTLKKVVIALKSLETEPRPHGCKKLKNKQNVWRIRIGNYRIVYSIFEKTLIVDVITIAHRKEVYNL